MNIKLCRRCFKDKPLSEFPKYKKNKDGLHSYCRVCCNINRGKYHKRDRELYIEYKKELKCQQCEETHPACLVFHHRNPGEKKFSISQYVGKKTAKQIMNEISKCDILCSNCHKKLHYDLRETENEKAT